MRCVTLLDFYDHVALNSLSLSIWHPCPPSACYACTVPFLTPPFDIRAVLAMLHLTLNYVSVFAFVSTSVRYARPCAIVYTNIWRFDV